MSGLWHFGAPTPILRSMRNRPRRWVVRVFGLIVVGGWLWWARGWLAAALFVFCAVVILGFLALYVVAQNRRAKLSAGSPDVRS